jgi:EAL domain-containing protein (putative c-di-GMP-specific phosphodiesterase class I)
MQWASRLEQALDDNRFVLFGQRIQTLRSTDEAHPAFIEILLRLPDEHGQLILPAALIPAAERFHKITRIDRWVLTQITNWIAAHPDQTEIFSVNISGDSLSDSQFQQFALARISALHTQSGRICLEVTETAAITHLAAARSFLQAIRAAGARVALDDFGAGASSFGYLKQFPADFLKIDGQFVRDILNDPLDRAAVTCFREIATICGAQTIAEFVESAETLTELQHLGIDFVQGFHIHLPQPLFSLVDPCSESKPGFYASRS